MLNPKYTNPKNFISPIINHKIKIDNLDKKIDIVENFYQEYKDVEIETNSYIYSFLEKLFYADYKIFDGEKLANGNGVFDLAIADDINDRYKVLIELKNPRSNQMIQKKDFFKKSFYQAIYYYLSDKQKTLFEHTEQSKVKYLIITNYVSWYFIRTSDIDALDKINRFPYINNAKVEHAYLSIENYFKNLKEETSLLHEVDLSYASFDLNEICSDNNVITKKENLTTFLKMLSPEYLLEKTDEVNKNKITNKFYKELLYILGLKEADTNFIEPLENNFSFYSLIQAELPSYLSNDEKYEIAMELIVIWINRILFIQLFSSVLVKYNILLEPILSTKNRYIFEDINTLFFKILNSEKRDENDNKELNFHKIPYINSALFQKTDIENRFNLTIDKLYSRMTVELYHDTQIDIKKDTKYVNFNILEYLIRFLNSYDIAVDENFSDNSDKDLINASVLGMVFEKLNGYKDGSFYTPSYITEYMSTVTIEKAIIEKFNTAGFSGSTVEEIGDYIGRKQKEEAKNLFNSITICDPAVGSGHFLVSSLNVMLLYKAQLNLFEHIKYNQVSIIDDMFVINDLDDYNRYRTDSPIHEIYKELYEAKKEIISNSLFGVDINPKSVYITRLRLWIELLKHTHFINVNKLVLLPNIDINIKQGNSLISDYKIDYKFDNDMFDRYKSLISKYKNPDNNRIELSYQIDDIKCQFNSEFDNVNKFEWRYEFPEALDEDGDFVGFDVVIGNPPYISLSNIKEVDYSEYEFSTYEKNTDIYVLFFEKMLPMIKTNGYLSFIVSNSWVQSKYGNTLRELLNSMNTKVLNFKSMQLFEGATVETCIVEVSKKNDSSISIVDIDKFNTKKIKYSKFLDMLHNQENNYEEENHLQMKILNNGTLLENCDIEIFRGILTGCNDAFIIDTIKQDELIEQHTKSSEVIIPLLRGKDIQKYQVDFNGKWLINTYNGTLNKKSKKRENRVDIDNYQAIKKHLNQYIDRIEKRKDKGVTPYNLRNCAYEDKFKKPKIIWGEISDEPKFAYDESRMYIEATAFCMTGKNLKYILAILNSKLSKWYFSKIATTTGMGTNRWKKYKLLQLPIAQASDTHVKTLTSLVDKLLNEKKKNIEIENEIDHIVYDLYNLTQEEENIIEKSYFIKEELKKTKIKNQKSKQQKLEL
ncbi:MAG: hypothetical protein GQ570_15335 [Helicobacteraceae bacterium]|nr:hypothetical protein [Helicobacteraceae bacterium]